MRKNNNTSTVMSTPTKISALFALFLSVAVHMSASAPYTTPENNNPVCLNELPAYKTSGQNVVWDFNDSTNTSEFTRLEELFRNDDRYTLTLGYTEYVGSFLSLKENDLFWLRADNRQSGNDSVSDIANPIPMLYNDSCPGGFVLKSKRAVDCHVVRGDNVVTKADGVGTIILPDGDTVCNALRLKTEYAVHIDLKNSYNPPADSPETMRLSTYEWYSPEHSYPIFWINAVSIQEDSHDRDIYAEAYYCSNKARELYEKNEKIRRDKEAAGILLRYTHENWPISNVELDVKGRKANISFESGVGEGNITIMFGNDQKELVDPIESPVNVGSNNISFKLPKLKPGRYIVYIFYRGVVQRIDWDVE